MLAILIFAGQSKRFWPLSEKSLFPIASTCLLTAQIGHLQNAGCSDVLLVGGAHNIDEAKLLFPNDRFVLQEDLSLGMRGALLSALKNLPDQPILLVSANDRLEQSAYSLLLSHYHATSCDGVLLARKVDQYFPGGYLSLQGNRIDHIVEKPGAGNEPSDLINLVAHIHRSSNTLYEALTNVTTDRDDGYEVALDTLFQSHRYEAVPYTDTWQAVKYPWHMLSLLPLMLADISPDIHPSATIHPTACISGSVRIGKNVKVMAHTTITGPCTIDDDSVIANNALVRQSSVGKRCVVGFGSEICRSVLADDVWTHMSYVGDSILSSNVSLGGGTSLGNLRFDEDVVQSMVGDTLVSTGLTKCGAMIGAHCRTGVNASLLPGVKIGSNSLLGAGIVIDRDIPENSFVKLKSGAYEVVPNRKDVVGIEKRSEAKKGIV